MKIKVRIKSIEERYRHFSNYYNRYIFEDDDGYSYAWITTIKSPVQTNENEEWIISLRGCGFNKGIRMVKNVHFFEKVG